MLLVCIATDCIATDCMIPLLVYSNSRVATRLPVAPEWRLQSCEMRNTNGAFALPRHERELGLGQRLSDPWHSRRYTLPSALFTCCGIDTARRDACLVRRQPDGFCHPAFAIRQIAFAKARKENGDLLSRVVVRHVVDVWRECRWVAPDVVFQIDGQVDKAARPINRRLFSWP